MEKQTILNKLNQCSLDQLDKIRDDLQAKLTGMLKEYHLAKDELLTTKHNKRKSLLELGNTHSKVEQLLRADDELFNLKRKVMGLSDNKKELEHQLEIVTNFYWKARR